MIKLSIVIPAYNEAESLPHTLDSIRAQDMPYSHEIIVVDNNSTDTTAAIAKEKGATVIREKKQGLCYARQAGLDAARGEILMYLDADTILRPGWIKAVITYLDTHPEVSGLSCGFRFHDGRVIDNVGMWISRHTYIPIMNTILRMFGKPDLCFGQSSAMHTEALRKAGGIDLDYPFYGEDTSLAFRLATQGKVVLLQNEYVLMSARRYQRLGALKTLWLYWTVLVLMELGLKKQSIAFSKKYS